VMKPAVKFYFIGMPGSGKTTIAKQVAHHLNLPFVDLDDEIVRREGITIQEIFKTKGERHFRLIESALLKEYAESNDSFVMATGGGAPCFHDGIDIINHSGVSIFLNESLSTIAKRVANKSDRPLLSAGNDAELISKLEKTFNARIAIYNKAKTIVENPTLESVLEKLDVKK
jgi:shikimate kinase